MNPMRICEPMGRPSFGLFAPAVPGEDPDRARAMTKLSATHITELVRSAVRAGIVLPWPLLIAPSA